MRLRGDQYEPAYLKLNPNGVVPYVPKRLWHRTKRKRATNCCAAPTGPLLGDEESCLTFRRPRSQFGVNFWPTVAT